METYILRILEKNNRVIVPEFGAFIVKQREPLTIVFNEFLQYNDGMLVDFISKTDEISKDEAKNKIDTFIKKVSKDIQQGKSYSLGGLGMISKSAAGKISIEISGETEKPVKKAANKDSIDIIKKPEATKQATDQKKDQPPPKVKEIIEKKPDKEVKKVSEEKKEVTKPPVISPEPVKKPEPKPTPKKEFNTSQNTPVQTKSKRRTNIIIWIIIIVIVNGIIIGYFVFNDEVRTLFSNKTNDIELLEIEEEEMLVPATIEDVQTVDEELPLKNASDPIHESVEASTTSQKIITSGTRYYVVAGVFGDEQNADKLVTDLRNEGYNSEKFGKIGNLHAVSFDVFENKADADRLLKQVKQTTNPDAWIRTVK